MTDIVENGKSHFNELRYLVKYIVRKSTFNKLSNYITNTTSNELQLRFKSLFVFQGIVTHFFTKPTFSCMFNFLRRLAWTRRFGWARRWRGLARRCGAKGWCGYCRRTRDPGFARWSWRQWAQRFDSHVRNKWRRRLSCASGCENPIGRWWW